MNLKLIFIFVLGLTSFGFAYADSFAGKILYVKNIRLSPYSGDSYFMHGQSIEPSNWTRTDGPACKVTIANQFIPHGAAAISAAMKVKVVQSGNIAQRALGIKTGSLKMIGDAPYGAMTSITCWSKGFQHEPTDQEIFEAFGSNLLVQTTGTFRP